MIAFIVGLVMMAGLFVAAVDGAYRYGWHTRMSTSLTMTYYLMLLVATAIALWGAVHL